MAFKYAISNTYAHATFAAANSVVEVSNSIITITAGNGLSGGGSFGLNNPDNASVTLSATSSSGGGLSSGGSGLSILTGNGLFTNTEGLQVKANTGIHVGQDGIFANGSAIFPSINDTGTKINLNLGDGYSYFPNTYLEVGKTQAPGTLVTTGQAVGLRLTAEANTISSNVSLSFGSMDTGYNGRHGAIINFRKEGLWTAGSGNYPGNLEFYTRPASGNEVLALVIDSTQNFNFQSGNITTTGYIEVAADGDPADIGAIRLGNGDTIAFRDSTNTFNVGFISASNPSKETFFIAGPGGTGITIDADDVTIQGPQDFSLEAGADLILQAPPAQGSEATSLMIDGSGIVGTRELGTSAFEATTYFTLDQVTTAGNITTNDITTTGVITVGSSSTTTNPLHVYHDSTPGEGIITLLGLESATDNAGESGFAGDGVAIDFFTSEDTPATAGSKIGPDSTRGARICAVREGGGISGNVKLEFHTSVNNADASKQWVIQSNGTLTDDGLGHAITTTGTISGVNVTSGSDPGHTHTTSAITDFSGTDYLSATGADTAAGAITFNAGLTIGASQQIIHNATSTKDKIRLWSSSAYAIGMINSVTYGGLNGYAMTFQMDTTANRGFWWGDSNDTLAQGVMAITSDDGLLTVAGGARIGFGKSDSTDPTSDGLEVAGLITTNQITETSNLLAFAGTGTPVLEINSSAASGTDAELRIDGSRTGSSTSNIARISFRNLGDETAMITMRDPAASSGTDHGELVFRTAKSGTLTDQMIIHHDGLVEVRNGGFKVGDVKDVTATPSTYVFERSDSGRTIGVSAVPSGGLVCNTNVFSGGETVTIYNGTVNDVTIGANTGFTLRLAGTTSTGNRTLAIFGVATILFIDGGASGHISGAGLS